jgi:murein DD-endopeptidase
MRNQNRSILITIVLFSLVLLQTSFLPGQSSVRPSPVEVVAPKPPTPVTIEGKQVLVYELHITNFGPSALTLTGIEVYDASADPERRKSALATYSGAALTKMLQPVGAADPKNLGHLEVGKRVIVFIYLPLPPQANITVLRHRFSFDVADVARRKGTPNDESALDGVMVRVLQQKPIVLSPPFKPGIWYAGNGPSNDSVHRRSVIAVNGRAYVSQRFAIDWAMVGSNGDTHHDSRARNENFWGFGRPVLAVADGEVTEAVDGIADNLPDHPPLITLQNIAGNHVIMRIAPDTYVMFAHLKQGSIRVRPGQQVKTGEVLGELGSSGSTTAPHMHFEVMDAGSPLAAEGVPWVFDSFRFLGWGREFEINKPHPDEPRQMSLPADDSVISIP